VRGLAAIPVHYDERMVADAESFSPSAGKPRAVVASWQAMGAPIALRTPVPVTRAQLALAHLPDFVDGVLEGRLANGFGNRLPAVAASLPWTSGAMLSAAREALANGRVAVAPTSGFHHAHYVRGGGFCTFNGLMVTAQVLLTEGAVRSVGILDFDLHYGDGTEDIIERLQLRGAVAHYTAGLEWNDEDRAPAFLEAIAGYVRRLSGCDVLLYQAGADPHIDDPMGGWLTDAQLAERDWRVFAACAWHGLPVAWNLAGGYQTPLRKVLDVHDATMRACADVYALRAS
jgi:acetoin utilization deacetylase AcuC-like enzyme